MRYIYCHPLFDERKCGHRFSYKLAKAFEKNNLQLERFDYQGTGEAEGAFCDITIDSLRNDLKTIINGDRVSLLGTRFGAAIAFDFCCRNEAAINELILIEPVVNGQSYVEYLFRKQHLKDMMTGNGSESADKNNFFNLEGYKTNSDFVEQIKEIQLIETAEKIKSGTIVHIVNISASSKINSEYNLFAKRLKKNRVSASVEVFSLPVFWERIPDSNYSILTEKIVEWCR